VRSIREFYKISSPIVVHDKQVFADSPFNMMSYLVNINIININIILLILLLSLILPYKMNIWWQFNLVNQSFLSDWWILYW